MLCFNCKHLQTVIPETEKLENKYVIMPFLSVAFSSSSNIRGTSKNNSCQGCSYYILYCYTAAIFNY